MVTMGKKGLIFGIAGQDGSFMAELLHEKGYLVYGVVKENTAHARLIGLKKSIPGIIIFRVDIADYDQLKLLMVKVCPDEVYNFSGVSDVINPMDSISKVLSVNGESVHKMSIAAMGANTKARFFQASSRLIFGSAEGVLNEGTPRVPTIPYGAAKYSADLYIKEAKDRGMYACSGIFFNHESEKRPERFFTRKVSMGVAKMHLGIESSITVGNLESMRDFGYAKDYMEAAWLMLQQDEPKDYVIGTGNLISTGDYLNLAIEMYCIRHQCHVNIEDQARGIEPVQQADISKIKKDLGWEPKTSVKELIEIMVDHDIALLQKQQHAGTVLVG